MGPWVKGLVHMHLTMHLFIHVTEVGMKQESEVGRVTVERKTGEEPHVMQAEYRASQVYHTPIKRRLCDGGVEWCGT